MRFRQAGQGRRKARTAVLLLGAGVLLAIAGFPASNQLSSQVASYPQQQSGIPLQPRRGAGIDSGSTQQPAPTVPGVHAVASAVEAAAAANLSRWSPHAQLGQHSRKWQPLVLPSCMEGMPPHWAPCMVGAAANPALAYGEELLYPAFSIPEPNFIRPEHAAWWRGHVADYAPDRFRLRGGRGVFADQHGQNLVLRNVKFVNNPPTDAWLSHACMGAGVSHRGLQPLAAGAEPQWEGRAVLSNPPESWAYQHFLDRAAEVLVQAEGWIQEGTRLVGGAAPHSAHVDNVWEALSTRGGHKAVFGASEFSAAEVVFSCRTPLIHPYFGERLKEIMQLPEPAPLDQRKVVLYFSRNQDSGGNKGIRQVVNEAAVVEAIRGALAERDRGEELVMYDSKKFPTVAELGTYLASEVAAMVGPHGGALYNSWWAPRGTLLLEFYPLSNLGTLFWEESSVRGLQYWLLPSPAEAPSHNMTPDPQLVAQIIREHLGKQAASEEPQLHSEWDLAQLLR